jgi:uncharacterized protein
MQDYLTFHFCPLPFSFIPKTNCMSATTLPVPQTERAQILDVLRGFAILGILLDNMFAYTGYFFLPFEKMQALPTWPADGALALTELALVHGKFYSLFSLLFGIGFSIILLRNQQRKVNSLRVFYRRIVILLLFGALHLCLWSGDILFLYALLGMFLPFFRNLSNRTLLITAVALIVSPVLIDLLKVAFQIRSGTFLETIGQSLEKKNGIRGPEDLSRYFFDPASGLREFWVMQEVGFFYRYAYIIESNRIPKVLGMFLFGLYAGRQMLYANLADHQHLLRQLRKWGFIVGIPCNIAMAWFEIDGQAIPAATGLLDTFFYATGVVPLSLAITASICLWWVKKEGRTKWRYLAPVGRMALTNYLMHTLISIFLFYGIGLALGGNIGPSIFFPVAFLIFGVQVLYSNWWFRYFNYGPMEWIWRQLTYGKRLPLRKQNNRLVATVSPVEVAKDDRASVV